MAHVFVRHAAGIALSLICTAGFSIHAGATERPKVVVELFTSQGCSSCPPANANLIRLSQQPGVLALSFAVTYWDSLGWKDIFGRPEFTDRQVVYEPALGEQGPFTPQMVFNGRTTAVGNDLGEVKSIIARAGGLAGPSIDLGASAVKIAGGNSPVSEADVWLVEYDPNIVEVPVARGENSGATLPHTHVVHLLKHLGTWSGQPVAYNFAPAKRGLHTAILVQQPQGGPILAAATD